MNEIVKKHFQHYNGSHEGEQHCGIGSSMWYTVEIRKHLIPFLNKYGFRSMLDAPCGDFGWMSQLEFPSGFIYTGGDICDNLVARNSSMFPQHKFLHLDITEDPLPEADLIFCRDCLFHLPSLYKIKFLKNFAKSSIPFILTSHHPKITHNVEQREMGNVFQAINWNLEPWNFPDSIDEIYDYGDEKDDWRFSLSPYRVMKLWSQDQIIYALSNLNQEID